MTSADTTATEAALRTFGRNHRVLIAAELYGMGGTEAHLTNLCQLLRGNNVDVTLATRFANPRVPLFRHAAQLGIHVVSTPFASRLKMFKLSTAWAYAAWPSRLRSDYDAIYTFGVTKFTSFLARRLKRGGRLIWHPFGNPEHLRDSAPFNGIHRIDTIVAESPIHQEVLEERFRGAARIVQLPCLSNAFDYIEDRAPRQSNVVRVAFLGRYDENKGASRLLRIWPHLRVGAARLDFFGDGPLRHVLEDIVRRDALSNVEVHGGWSGREQLRSILEQTDLVVLPSASEGIPLVLVESMSFGVPFVATNVGAIRWLAEDNPDVRVVAAEDLPAAIEDVVARVRVDNAHQGRLRRYFEDRFGYGTASRRWLSFILSPEPVATTNTASAAQSSSGRGLLALD